MTHTEQLSLALSIHPGVLLKGAYLTMRVTEIKNDTIIGHDEVRYIKTGKKSELRMTLSTLMNPHYNKDIRIENEQ